MGFRFRKSFGKGPFRLNISKSGVGWSIGGKGARYTKKAGGGSRTTFSVPGTGLSYVTDSSKKKTTNQKRKSKGDNAMLRKPAFVEVEVPQSWMTVRLGLTPSESELFMTAVNAFGNKSFTPRDMAAAGCSVSTSIYSGLYNKNVFNKNEDKSWCVNTAFVNQVGREYQLAHQPKGHSAILHILFGGFALYIPSIYYLFSKNHYYHI